MSTLSQPERDSRQHGIDFLRLEISLGNTFLDVAKTSQILANQQQGKRDAENAYRSACCLYLKLPLTREEKAEIGALLTALQARFVAAGLRIDGWEVLR